MFSVSVVGGFFMLHCVNGGTDQFWKPMERFCTGLGRQLQGLVCMRSSMQEFKVL